jgi:solute carrier family 6 amino acid transporter-like protein 5/7/9/14
MAPRERGSWSNHWEFLLTSLGMAVGLGNVWRFPYVTYANGGGTFLIPYVLCLVFMAWPVLFQEMAMGQISGAGCNKVTEFSELVRVFHTAFITSHDIQVFPAMAPIFKGLAHAMIYLRISAQVYFMVITSWAFYFLFAGFQSELPWSTCTEDWNTRDCYSISYNDKCSSDNVFFNFTCSTKNEYCHCQWHGYESWITDTDSCILQGEETPLSDIISVYSVSPAEDYLNGKVLGLSKDQDGTQYSWTDYGSMRWELILCQLLGWLIVSAITIRGIRSLGKAAYVLTVMPYVLLTILLVYSVTLEGAADGIYYFLKPDWEKLADSNVWLQASIQIATSTAIACGSHLVLASFNSKTNNVLTDSIVIAALNSLTSIYAGFVVFSMTGFLAHETRTSVDNVRMHNGHQVECIKECVSSRWSRAA